MDRNEFNRAYKIAKRRIRDAGGNGVSEEQAYLRALVPRLATEDDRRVANDLIDNLPQRAAPPPPPSPLYAEALKIHNDVVFSGGSTIEERVAILTAARKQILAIADRAPADEAPGIAALTRTLEHIEDGLLNDPWMTDDPQSAREH